MPRFFVEDIREGMVFVGGEDGRHMVRSLRMRPGETVTLCDGAGRDYPGVISSCQEEGAWVQVEAGVPSRGEPATQVTVCQCLSKGDKLDTVTQKAVELGAAAIWPVESARCVAKWDRKAAEKKRLRLQKIAREAAMQSGRGIIPPVGESRPLEQALQAAAQEGEILFFYERGQESLQKALAAAGKRLFLFVGPEGGFAPEEAELARSLGGRVLSLGPRILRTETAPLAALAAVFFARGDMELPGSDSGEGAKGGNTL